MSLPRSLQGRLLALVTGSVVAVWLAASLLTWRDARHELDELLDSHLAQAAALLVARQAGEIEDERLADAPLLHRYASRVAFQVWHEGRLVLRSANAPATPMAEPTEGFQTVAGGAWRVFAARGAEQDVTVYVGERLAARDAILRGVLRGLLGPMLLALPLLALLGWWAIRRGLRPLHELGQALARRAPQALEPVHTGPAPAELRPLVDALNRLFERLAALLAAERRFTADAAHELRTPLTSLRGYAELYRQGAIPDEAGVATAMGRIESEGGRMARLVDDLLLLARVDQQRGLELKPLDLAALAEEAATDFRVVAPDHPLTTELTGPVTVQGDRVRLRQVLDNLLTNARLHTPRGTAVRVAVTATAKQAELVVADGGPGIAPEDQPRVFERFWRADPARARRTGGSGLGLAIVQGLIEAHGGTVTLESAPGQGATFRVRLPLA